MVVHVVAHDLDAGERRHRAAQHIEVAVDTPREQMGAGLDHGLTAPLRGHHSAHGVEDLVVGEGQCVDVGAAEIDELDRAHVGTPTASRTRASS